MIPADLIYDNSVNLEAKLAAFKQVGTDGLHIIFDFDRTLTVARPDVTNDITTWHILDAHLPEVGRRYHQSLFKK
jgi:hypothetical protein